MLNLWVDISRVLLKTTIMANPIPNIVLHSQFVGTTDSADFQGLIARPVSGDFHHFFAQIATEYDGDPIPTVWQTRLRFRFRFRLRLRLTRGLRLFQRT